MRNFSMTRALAQAESVRMRRNLSARLESTSPIKVDENSIVIKQFVCFECGLLIEHCVCKPKVLKSAAASQINNLRLKKDVIKPKKSEKSEAKFVKPKFVSGVTPVIAKLKIVMTSQEENVTENYEDTLW